jgi:hypothetical protein
VKLQYKSEAVLKIYDLEIVKLKIDIKNILEKIKKYHE